MIYLNYLVKCYLRDYLKILVFRLTFLDMEDRLKEVIK